MDKETAKSYSSILSGYINHTEDSIQGLLSQMQDCGNDIEGHLERQNFFEQKVREERRKNIYEQLKNFLENSKHSETTQLSSRIKARQISPPEEEPTDFILVPTALNNLCIPEIPKTVSIASPLGKSALNKKPGDLISYSVGPVKFIYEVIEVE